MSDVASLADIEAILQSQRETPLGVEQTPASRSEMQRAAAAAAGPQPERGVLPFFKTAAERDWLVYGLAATAVDAGIEYDPSFNLKDVDEKEWGEITEGMADDQIEGLGMARSRSHLYWLVDRITSANKAEAELASYGGWGVAGRVVTSIADPTNVLLAVSTGGLSVAAKAERLERAVVAARAAGNLPEARIALEGLEAAAKQSPLRSALRTGLLASAENAALETALVATDPTRDGWDVVYAATGGLILGSAVGRLMSGREQRALRSSWNQQRRLTELAELDATLAARRAELLPKLGGDPDSVRAQLQALDAEVAALVKQGFDPSKIDVPSAKARLAELDDYLVARRAEIEKTTSRSPALKKLNKEIDGLRKQLAELESPEPRAARMLQEDIEKLGPEVANSKQYTKLRNSAAKSETEAARKTLGDALADAQGRRNVASQTQRQKTEDAFRKALRKDTEGTAKVKEAASLRAALGMRERIDTAAPQREALTKLDNLDTVRNAADQQYAAGAPSSFGGDTLSAAKAAGVIDDIHDVLRPSVNDMPNQARMQYANATKLIGNTFAGVLRGSTSEKVRSTLGRIVGNSVGNEDGSTVAVGASEIAARLAETTTAKWNSVATPAYREWAERQGYGILDRQTRQVRDEFMQQVGRAIRGELVDEVDPAVKKLAARQSELFAEFLREAKDAGVKGFENVEQNGRYLPRVFDFENLRRIDNQYGTDGLRKLVAGAIRAGDDEITEELAEKIAKAYVGKMRQMRVGSDAHLMAGVKWDDVGFLRRFLSESGMDDVEVGKVVDEFAALNAKRARQTEGNFRYAKKRQAIDESFSLKLYRANDEAGNRLAEPEWTEVRFSDLLENNAEALFQRYARTVSGHVGLAKVGIKDRADFNAMIEVAENELAGDLDELKRVKSHADMAYRLVTGQPIEESEGFMKLSRTMRDWNFTTTMNQAGFAQIPDLAGLLSKGYLRHTMENLPWAFKAMRRKDGSLDDEFAREMEEWVGIGTDYHNNAVFSAYDHDATRFQRGLGAVGHTARVLGRGTQSLSGMAFITSFAQRLTAKAIVQRLVKETLEGGAFSARRSADLGLDAAMSDRIGKQLKAHTSFVSNEAGGKVRRVNWNKWDDVEARDAMLNAVFRESRRLVQEEDLGDTSKWMHSNMGKLIAQFRRFALVSYTKQVLHGIAHKDAETATRAIVSMGLAAISYRVQWELRLAQTPEEKREEMRERYLSWDAQAAAAFSRSSYASLLPAVIDTPMVFLTDKKLFDNRTSGLDSNLLEGIPTYALGQNVLQLAKATWDSTTRSDRQFTQSDARALRRLLPFQNLLGMDAAFNAITADLPSRHDDENPDEAEWFFQ
ncbi:hypothetical protein J2X02_003472 [Pseudoxanthomonas japonensis]|uniref:hypothetical protein n=1 Tax=Pseudoxanthomonas japonensis TaxID=69284 RepID=UPI0028580A00|nr:hypothetical protein [Pseudoxanthomonas japonensis]MDR7070607.1 hypothetical protein [Pseudoxanthomonas japonensis]